jgi:hypothetical protein
MARTIVNKYVIYQGPDEHIWTLGDPPSPVGRYRVVRTIIVNDQVWEEPTEWEKKSLLPEEYTTFKDASDVCLKLNEAWFLTDPNWEFYKSQR